MVKKTRFLSGRGESSGHLPFRKSETRVFVSRGRIVFRLSGAAANYYPQGGRNRKDDKAQTDQRQEQYTAPTTAIKQLFGLLGVVQQGREGWDEVKRDH